MVESPCRCFFDISHILSFGKDRNSFFGEMFSTLSVICLV